MAYDEALAERIQDVLDEEKDLTERKMFGGVAYMIGGNMCCGVVKDELMVRVGPDAYAEHVARPHARPMDFTGKPLEGMVYVAAAGLKTKRDLAAWVRRGLKFARSLPAK